MEEKEDAFLSIGTHPLSSLVASNADHPRFACGGLGTCQFMAY